MNHDQKEKWNEIYEILKAPDDVRDFNTKTVLEFSKTVDLELLLRVTRDQRKFLREMVAEDFKNG